MDIVELAIHLHSEGVDLEQEDNTFRFLGVHMEHNPNSGFLNVMQKDCIKHVLETLGCDVETLVRNVIDMY